jgi:hypothetical protein
MADPLARLEAVREAAADPSSAYLIRSRLRRALLSCARTVAEMQRLEKPSLPGQWSLMPDAPAEIVAVVSACRRIHQQAKYLCQPSESFDVRWEAGWSQLRADLDQLEAALNALGKLTQVGR